MITNQLILMEKQKILLVNYLKYNSHMLVCSILRVLNQSKYDSTESETEDLLLSLTENCETPFEQTDRKAEKT